MKYYRIIFVVILLLSNNVSGQDRPADNIEKFMEEKILQLKDGALIVRLKTKENSIVALRKAGNHELADKVELKQKTYNKELIRAFRSDFKFCPVYFLPSNYSENIIAGKIADVVFVNDSLDPDTSITMTQLNFLTAETGPLDPDTASYFESQHYDYSGKNLEKKETQYIGQNAGFEVIKMMNKEFIQLTQPFPYYVRIYDSLPMERSLPKAVARLNEKLQNYYNAVVIKR